VGAAFVLSGLVLLALQPRAARARVEPAGAPA
jgi:hypothetical protein